MKQDDWANVQRCTSRGLSKFNRGILPGKKLETILNTYSKTHKKIRVLEIGLGRGVLLLELANLFPSLELVGINKKAIHGAGSKSDLVRTAKKLNIKSPRRWPSIVLADAVKLPFEEESFDFVVSQVSFAHIRDKLRAMEEVCRVLKVGGSAFLGLDAWDLKKKKCPGPMPSLYKRLYRQLGKEATPRLVCMEKGHFVSLKEIMTCFGGNCKIQVRRHSHFMPTHFHSPRFLVRVYIRKTSKGRVRFPLVRDSKLSRQWNSLPDTDHNPTTWGIVDVYKLS